MSARLVVMVSGSGTNLQALLDACRRGRLDARVVLVVSNRRDAYALVRAERAGVPGWYVPFDRGRTRRETYDAELAERVAGVHPDLIVLAGWMHIFSAAFLARFPRRVVNLHPALPGQFPGTRAIERAFAAFADGRIGHGGCMVHYAIPEVDAGDVIADTTVAFDENDTLESYRARVHAAEHRLIVAAIAAWLERAPGANHHTLPGGNAS